jgi:hypothetical protein
VKPTALAPWGVQLSSGDFACALAAAGALDDAWRNAAGVYAYLVSVHLSDLAKQTNGVLPWRAFNGLIDSPVSAEMLKDAWKLFLSRQSTDLRIEIQLEGSAWDPLWVLSELSRPDVGAASVYLGASPDQSAKGPRHWHWDWHWPLRMGLLAGPGSKSLAASLQHQIKAADWPESILSVVDATAAGRCDLLIVSGGIRAAVAEVLSLSLESSIESPCVVVAGPISSSRETWRLADILGEQTQAQAVALVNPGSQPLEQWILDLLAGISHDQPFDLALASSLGPKENRPFYFLRANREWIESVRLSSIAGTLRQKLGAAELADQTLDVGPELAERLAVPYGQHPIQQLREFADYYRHETEGATTLALLTNALAPKLRESHKPAGRRFLQAKVLDARRPADPPLPAFRAGALHKIDIRIGPRDRQWISSSDQFPQEQLPPSARGHWLTVVASNPAIAPQVGRIFLPPAGPSTTCSVYLETAAEPAHAQLRVCLLYRNRVLQTFMLEGLVSAAPEETADSDRIAFHAEVVVDASLDDLDGQGSFGAAMILNHTSTGAPQVLKVVDDHAELISTGDLTRHVELIEDKLRDCKWAAKTYRSLTAPGTVAVLRYLAIHGSLLYWGVVKGQFQDPALAAAMRIQLIAARPGVRLPVEYFYDRPSPAEDAPLCPFAAKALTAGKCPAQCAAHQNSNSHICPLGFWGLTRVLEWHTYRPQTARQLGNSDFALQNDRNAARQQLHVLDRAIVGASDRANAEVKNSVPRLLAAIRKLEVPCTLSTSWREWTNNIAALSPSLLVLIAHTGIHSDFDVAKMEIGTEDWLTVDQIDDSYVHKTKVQPVILLLGCETSQTQVVFEDFISRFTLSGAAIVVASNTMILGRQATILAEQFVAVLKKMSANKGSTFGDVMLAVRRLMLRKGYPMVLSVTAWGDAGWRL